MTVSTTTSKSDQYTSNGVTTVFNYSFRVLDKSHLLLEAVVGGFPASLVVDTHYTVQNVGANSGTITLTAAGLLALPSGSTFYLIRYVPILQNVDLQNQGAYFAETIEDSLDLLTMIDQELRRDLDDVTWPAGANAVLALDGNGDKMLLPVGQLLGGPSSFDARGSLAGRAAYNAEAVGFTYLVTDAVPMYFTMRQGASGNWSPSFFYGFNAGLMGDIRLSTSGAALTLEDGVFEDVTVSHPAGVLKLDVKNWKSVNTLAEARALDPAAHPVIRRIVNGHEHTYHWDATVPKDVYGNDPQNVFFINLDATYVAPGAWVSQFHGSKIYASHYGVKSGLAAQDTNLTALLVAVKYVATFHNGPSSGTLGGPEVIFPAGVIPFANTLTLQNFNGITFRGAGNKSTVLLYTGSTYQLDFNQVLGVTFENIWFMAGTVSQETGAGFTDDFLQVTPRAAGLRVTTCIDWRGENSGQRQNAYKRCRFTGYALVFDIGLLPGQPEAGQGTHSEVIYDNCYFDNCDKVLYLSNNQSIDHYFNWCDTDFIETCVIEDRAGGQVSVIGGSHINKGDFYYVNTRINAGHGAGNCGFSMRDAKFEMFQNFFGAAAPQIIKVEPPSGSVGAAYKRCVLENVNALSGTDYAAQFGSGRRTILSLHGDVNVDIKGGSMYGNIICEPRSGQVPTLSLDNMDYYPEVTRTENLDLGAGNGTKFRLKRTRCGGSLEDNVNPLLNRTFDLDLAGGTKSAGMNSSENVAIYRLKGNSAGAVNIDQDFPAPNTQFVGSIFRMRIIRQNAVQVDVQFFRDAARTQLLFSANGGSTILDGWFAPAFVASVATAAAQMGARIYARIVTAAAAGNVDVRASFGYLDLVD